MPPADVRGRRPALASAPCTTVSAGTGTALAAAVLLAAALLAAPPVTAQTAAASAPLRESLQSLSRLMSRVPNASVSLNFAEFKVRMAASKLQEAAAAWPSEAPAEYRANVAAQVSALEAALRTPDPEVLTRMLDALAEDLTAKASHADRGGAPTVAVTVRTVQGGRDAEGWQVMYRPRMIDAAGSADSARPFSTADGAARAALVPGRYVFWGRRGAEDSAPMAVTIGEGQPDAAIDLDVAAAARP